MYTFGVAVDGDFHSVLVQLYSFSTGDNFLDVKGRSLNKGLDCLGNTIFYNSD